MVNSTLFIPKEEDLACLKGIHGSAQLLRPPLEHGTFGEVLIVSNNGHAACIESDYGDVRFKFECFYLNVFSCGLDSSRQRREICTLHDWNSIKCLFRSEYERPARDGEVPRSWEQIVRRRGKKKDVPDEAIAIGCALVGIVFWNLVLGTPVLMIANE